MICSIHQPQFLPWLGYLHKISQSDVFVFLDDVQFKKNEFQNRNKIMVNGQPHWLTVPVSFRFGDTLREVRMPDDIPWSRKLLTTLECNCSRMPHYKTYMPGLAALLQQRWENLAALNQATVVWLMDCFGIRTRVVTSSELPPVSQDATQRLVDLCRLLGADVYLSGAGGHDYLEVEAFARAGIRLEFQNFLHPVYRQCYSSATEAFVSHLSAIDALFHCGGGDEGRALLGIQTQELLT